MTPLRDHLERWDLRDPADALEQVARSVPLRIGTVALASFDCRDGGAVDLHRARVVHDGSDRPDEHVARRLISEAAERVVDLDLRRPPGRTALIVICREGRVISTSDDWFWFNAWRYTSHPGGLFTGEHYVLTPHGWTGLLDERAGFDPRITIDPT